MHLDLKKKWNCLKEKLYVTLSGSVIYLLNIPMKSKISTE